MNDRVQTNFTVPDEEFVSASELREFLYCERAWFLNRSGFDVSNAAKAHRVEGVQFHHVRAVAPQRATLSNTLALLLALVAIILTVLAGWRPWG